MTPKLITRFTDDFTLEMISHSIFAYIGLWALKMRHTRYGFCEQTAFTNARAMYFFEVGQEGQHFFFLGEDHKISKSLWVAAPAPIHLPLDKGQSGGGGAPTWTM